MESTSGVLSLVDDIGCDGEGVFTGVATGKGVIGKRVTGGGGARKGSTGKRLSMASMIRSVRALGAGASLTLVKTVSSVFSSSSSSNGYW
jgi:hypothetical protein